MPEAGIKFVPRQEILTLEEIARMVRIAAGMGLRRVRLTGGEPLVRNGITQLVRWIAETPGIEDISLTTNGMVLASYAEELARAGLKRVNVSLDTLRPDRFREITRHGDVAAVYEGIAAARAAGLSPIKINVVVMREVNDDEAADIARTTLEEDWEVRFIELMPFMDEQETCIKDTSLVLGFVPTQEVRAPDRGEPGPAGAGGDEDRRRPRPVLPPAGSQGAHRLHQPPHRAPVLRRAAIACGSRRRGRSGPASSRTTRWT